MARSPPPASVATILAATANGGRGAATARGPPHSNECLIALHPPADRDVASRDRGDAWRLAGLLVASGVRAASGRFPDRAGDDAASRRQPGHHRLAGDGAARADVRTNPVAPDDAVVVVLRHQPGRAPVR